MSPLEPQPAQPFELPSSSSNPHIPSFMIILAWNVRGAGGTDFKRIFRDMVNLHHPSVVILTETRLSGARADSVIPTLGFDSFIKVDAMGFAGGIWVLWHSHLINVNALGSSFQEIHCLLKVNNLSFLLTAIYASPSPENRNILWNSLSYFSTLHSVPWLLMGDFNDYSNSSEKFGGRPPDLKRMENFNSFLNNCNLLDLGFVGPLFTWTNCQQDGHIIRTRIDRAQATQSWINLFPNSKVFHLPIAHSDHCPILLNSNPLLLNDPKPFRLEPFWLHHPTFLQTTAYAWSLDNNPLSSKLSFLKDHLKSWQRSYFDNFFLAKRKINKRLLGIQNSLCYKNCPQLLFLEKNLQTKFKSILDQEEQMWHAKSRINWLSLGDRNTSFFHASTINRRRRNSFTSTFPLKPTPNLPIFNTDFSDSLILPPPISEIRSVTFSLPPLKAPGKDGFHVIFFQKSWDIIQHSLFNEINKVFSSSSIPKEWGETLISLIPKIDNASKPSQLRPIGLCSSHYKILAKILANRLKPFLPNLISPFQGAFQKEKHTSDLFISAHEIMHSMNKSQSKNGWLILKIDLHKAFDTISWSFINSMLSRFNFPSAFINLISSCISSVDYTLLFNGKLSNNFSPKRGIRQGDPLSPYIFILAMEYLNHQILEAISQNQWSPFSFRNSNIKFSHFFFADDILLFSKATVANSLIIKDILTDFSNVSSLDINFSKSKLWFSPSTPPADIDIISSIFNINVSDNLGSYLGIRQSHNVNECYMAKILWNIKTDNNSLSSQIIKAKYGQNLERNIHSKSYIRRSLDKGLSVFNLGLAWRIGNGLSINFWYDKWPPSGTVRSSISGPLNLQDSHKSVSDVLSNGLFDISLSLPPTITDEISSSFISLNNSPDFPAWPASKSGAFSIKSAYYLTLNPFSSSHPSSFQNLNWLWKVPCHPRVSSFL
ncbi:reverse transcriptase [Senna tora]|uniref:Reverse transcriptase n=1 Tax=Senna tora TaxID=362788 RepID=A0A834SGK9_9FABA|nr:reverse transcriptase [Senna tora]